MKHFRHSFLCKATLLLASIFLFNIIFVHQPTHAYYKNNCYAGGWLVDVSRVGNIGETIKGKETHRTNLVCYNGNKLTTKGNGQKIADLQYPKFKVSGNKVKITYCKSGPTTAQPTNNSTPKYKCDDKDTKEMTVNWDKESFEDFAKRIHNFIRGYTRDGFEFTGFKDNKNVSDLKKYDTKGNEKKEKSQSKCKSASKYLGWILCPVIELAGEAADGAYNEYIAPMLNIEPKLFAGGEDGAEGAWGTFRNFANIIFIILLLFIIFSQLTGVGIDNYGIKKSLPKMIIGAILINLSYILCVVAVDVSNILGNAFQALFTTLGESLKPELGKSITGDAVQSIAVTGGSLVGLGVFGYAVSTVAAPMVLLSLVMAAISLVSAIFFLFILLAAREAAIVVLTVISPVAIVLYALPNTKSYFDKWLSSFKALLMVYPIAGLLVGGGNYVSALLLVAGGGGGAVEDFSVALTAMVVSVVPIFFIPAVLKNSLAAFGNIGSKIASFGSGFVAGSLATGASNAIQRNARFQNWQRESDRARKLKDNKSTYKRLSKKDYSSLSGAQKRALGYSTAAIQGADREDIDAAKAYINKETNNGANTKDLFALGDAAAAHGDKIAQRAALEIAGRRADTANDYMKHILKKRGAFDDVEAKEIAEGANAANFRSSSPMKFEYASEVNKGKAKGSYNDFTAVSENIDGAIEHHITSAEDLMAMKNSELEELQGLVRDGKVSSKSKEQLENIIADVNAKSKAGTITVDRTKMDNINGVLNYNIQGPPPPPSPSPSSSSSPSPSSPSPSSSSSPSPSSPPSRRSGGIDIPH